MGETTIKARFVGGPWHNEVREVRESHVVFVAEQPKIDLWKIPSADELIDLEPIRKHLYHLMKFVSDGGAKYFQYIHESLVRGGVPCRTAYTDPPLPVFQFDPWKLIDLHLAMAVMRKIRGPQTD